MKSLKRFIFSLLIVGINSYSMDNELSYDMANWIYDKNTHSCIEFPKNDYDKLVVLLSYQKAQVNNIVNYNLPASQKHSIVEFEIGKRVFPFLIYLYSDSTACEMFISNPRNFINDPK